MSRNAEIISNIKDKIQLIKQRRSEPRVVDQALEQEINKDYLNKFKRVNSHVEPIGRRVADPLIAHRPKISTEFLDVKRPTTPGRQIERKALTPKRDGADSKIADKVKEMKNVFVMELEEKKTDGPKRKIDSKPKEQSIDVPFGKNYLTMGGHGNLSRGNTVNIKDKLSSILLAFKKVS